jgi:hypothetical protein
LTIAKGFNLGEAIFQYLFPPLKSRNSVYVAAIGCTTNGVMHVQRSHGDVEDERIINSNVIYNITMTIIYENDTKYFQFRTQNVRNYAAVGENGLPNSFS